MGINVVQNYILTDCVWRISARWTATQKSGFELAATNKSRIAIMEAGCQVSKAVGDRLSESAGAEVISTEILKKEIELINNSSPHTGRQSQEQQPAGVGTNVCNQQCSNRFSLAGPDSV